jgi:hypothetical protein
MPGSGCPRPERSHVPVELERRTWPGPPPSTRWAGAAVQKRSACPASTRGRGFHALMTMLGHAPQHGDDRRSPRETPRRNVSVAVPGCSVSTEPRWANTPSSGLSFPGSSMPRPLSANWRTRWDRRSHWPARPRCSSSAHHAARNCCSPQRARWRPQRVNGRSLIPADQTGTQISSGVVDEASHVGGAEGRTDHPARRATHGVPADGDGRRSADRARQRYSRPGYVLSRCRGFWRDHASCARPRRRPAARRGGGRFPLGPSGPWGECLR